jgi:anti-sigma factor RsiW
MNHRHLLPNEIDLLVDGEAGFGVAPLRAHLQECDECLERFEEAEFVAQALEELPHFAPDARLADRVMAQVPVFVPAHVAARETVRRWMPRSAGTRAAAAVAVATTAGALSLALLWLAAHGDAVLFVAGLAGDRFRSAVGDALRDVVVALLGDSALSALRASGAVGASLLVFGFLVAAIGTVAGIRRLATAGRRG